MSLSEDRLQGSSPFPDFVFFPLLLRLSPLRLGGGDTDVLSMDEHSTLTSPRHFDRV